MEIGRSAPSSRRSYVTPRRDQRAAATRTAILAAAEELFLRDGYTRTSMKAVASAGRRLGEDDVPHLLDQGEPAAAGHPARRPRRRGIQPRSPSGRNGGPSWPEPADEVFGRFAALNAATMTRTAAIIALGESAASTDPELAEYRDRAHAATRADLRALATELNRRGALGPGISEQDTVDTLYALATNESIFLRLTRQCGWTPERYADLIARTLTATLGTSDAP